MSFNDQNLAGFAINCDDHESSRQYGCSGFEHSDTPAQKRAKQSENNLANFPPPPMPIDSRMNPPLPPGRGGTGHMFYKTRLCVKFSAGNGNCRNGDGCNFAHGIHDLHHPPPNWQELIGGNGVGGKELGQRVEHRRNRNVCKMYYNGLECPYGEKCAYLHERPAPTPSLFDEGGGQHERESAAITIGLSSNQGRTDGYRSETNYNKSKPGERNNFDHFQTGSYVLRSCNDAMVKSRVIQSNPSVSAPLVSVAGDAIQIREKDDNTSRWKPNQKINRIYADWLDDLSPRKNGVSEAET